MMKRLNVTPIPWPFWCLALAWLCANLPSASRFDIKAGLSYFQHFSHQTELSVQTFALLHAKAAEAKATVAKAATTKAPQPALPAGETVKKIELSTAPQRQGLPTLFSEPHAYVISLNAPPQGWRAEPPHPPPKRSWVS